LIADLKLVALGLDAMTLAAVARPVRHATIFEANVGSYRRRAANVRKQHGPGRPPHYATPKNIPRRHATINRA
jgi:hypothetical protein